MMSDIQAQRILLVDDEPSLLDCVKMMLEFDGHQVETATNGSGALSLFDKGGFDLVITDYSMAGMKGDALAIAIKKRAPDHPIIMITAHAGILESTGNPLAGVDFVLSKPFQVAELRAAIAKVSAKADGKGRDEGER